MNPWTPGPWEVQDSPYSDEEWFIRAASDPEGFDVPQSAADARLIALAPEMAEFARGVAGIRDGCCGKGTEPLAWCIHDQARGLLAKARGEA